MKIIRGSRGICGDKGGGEMNKKGKEVLKRTASTMEEEGDISDISSSDIEEDLVLAPADPKNLYTAELNQEYEDDLKDEEELVLDDLGDADNEQLIRERINQSQERMRQLLLHFNEDQLKRYETFRRIGLSRGPIKKLMQKVLDQPVHTNSVIVVCGIAKVFVGELVEEGRKVMDELGETGPLTPFHIREAHRRLSSTNLIGSLNRQHCKSRLL